MSNAGEGASNRLSHAARGMFAFTATEKDCVDAEGNEEECVICFEEYEAGDRMARLVCWCKFHEVCCFSLSSGEGNLGQEIRVGLTTSRSVSRSGGRRKDEARVRRISCMSE
jgi:hypothetical protein